jgi:hypothetical protein
VPACAWSGINRKIQVIWNVIPWGLVNTGGPYFTPFSYTTFLLTLLVFGLTRFGYLCTGMLPSISETHDAERGREAVPSVLNCLGHCALIINL